MPSKNIGKHVVSILLLTLLSLHGAQAWAADTDSDSFDDAIDVDDDGDGLIEIATLTELDHIRNNLLGTAFNDGVNGDNSTGCGDGNTITACNGYELVSDLDFNTDTSDAVQVIDDKDQFWNGGAGWSPIGEDGSANIFRASFEGNGHTIFNLFINNTTDRNVGLFGRIEGNSDIALRNLNFAGELSEVVGTANFHKIGTLVGRIRGAEVSNISAEVKVGGALASNSTLGGLMGFARKVIASDLSATGVVDGNVNGNTGGTIFIGGLIGQMSGGLLQKSAAQVDVIDGFRAGGLVGQAAPFPSSVNGDDDADIEMSFALGNVTTSGTGGGLVGEMSSTSIAPGANLLDVFALGDVTAQRAAGLVGSVGSSGNYSITNAFAAGRVVPTGTSSSGGGLVNQLSGSAQLQVVDAYWDIQTTEQNTSVSAASGQTTEQLQCPTSNTQNCANGGGLYSNWPSNVWNFGASIQYPALVFNGIAQRDTDGDGELDAFDPDDDGDGILDGSDLCPFDADVNNTNFDADDQCDANDSDDDNDGYTDADENSNGGQSNPFSAVSFPADNDNDFVSDFNDPDDDNDGYSDIDELSNNGQSDPFNANSTPPDQDGDFISDFLDDDDDNDTVLDGDDNCPLDADTDNVNTDGDDLCNNNDLDDDNDTVLDADDNCPLTENMAQANNDSDNNGDACDDDDDNDTVLDGNDNCPFDFNLNQADSDGDEFGNVCDVDRDGDRLIEIFNLTQLDAIRNALDGSNINGNSQGCSDGDTPVNCEGFEVAGFLDFNTDRSDDVQVIDDKDAFFNGGAGWQPIGTAASPFTGRFDGNFRSISNLFINNSDAAEVGLFGYVSGGEIRNLFLQGELTSVTSTRPASKVGTFAGTVEDSQVRDVLARTAVKGVENSKVGGLFGLAVNGARVERSFASGSVTTSGSDSSTGGLVGETDGANAAVTLLNVLSDASIVAETNSLAGGLVANSSDTEIENAIAYGVLSGQAQRGAMVADDNNSSDFVASYWDLDIATQMGYSSDGGDGIPTAQLQCPTNIIPNQICAGGVQIYQNWRGNQAWHFGTSFQYPVRRTNGTVQRDTDGDGILDGDEPDPDNDGFEFGDDLCPFDQDFANVNSDDDDQCDGRDTDDDNDGYSDVDETDNGSSPIDSNDTPPDNDGDFISDLNDPDDDNDGNLDALDLCVFDADVANLNNDSDELCDSNDPDDDNDGVSDEAEIAAGLNPFVAEDPEQDSDGDGTPDLEEALIGSDVFDADSTPLNAGAGFNQWNSTGPDGGPIFTVIVDPSDADIAYGFTNSDIYRTTDRGGNWARFTDNLLPDQVNVALFSLAVDPNDSNTVYVGNRRSSNRLFKTVDAGQTWMLQENGLSVNPLRITADPISGDILYITGSAGEVFRTLDAAGSWAQVGSIPVSGSFLGDLFISPVNAAVIWAVSSSAVYVSSDAGATWSEVNTGFGTSPSVSSLVIDPTNVDVAYAVIRQRGIFKTVDRGQNWLRVDTGTPVDDLFVEKLVIDRNTPQTLYFLNGISVYKSIDGGVNWAETREGLIGDSGTFNDLAIGQDNSAVLYISDSNLGAFTTDDNALNWRLANTGIHHQEIDSLVRVWQSNEVTLTSRVGTGGVYTTKSAGARWDRKGDGINRRVFTVAVDPNNPNVRYSGGDSRIHKTVDGGESWQELLGLAGGSFSVVAVDPNDADVVYTVGNNSTLQKSIDAGSSWSDADVGLPELGFGQASALEAGGNEVYLALQNGQAGVYKSSNQAGFWTAVNNGDLSPGTRVFDLAYDAVNNRLYAAANGLLISPDGGASWSRIDTAPFLSRITVDPAAPEILIGASSFEGYFRSPDMGLTWQPLPIIVRDGGPSDLATGPARSSVVYAGTRSLGAQVIELANDLKVDFSIVENQVIEGREFTYQFIVSNQGSYDETRAVFRQELPRQANGFLMATSSQGSCTLSNGIVSCDIGMLAVNDSVTIEIKTVAASSGDLRGRVAANGYLSEVTPEDNDFIASVDVLVDTDGDSIPDIDDPNDDNDDFPDASDNCPLAANNSQADLDGDGQGDACDLDQDGDGISDANEIRNGLNPRNPGDAALDFDNDGLTNRQEIDLRTDIRNADTDGDGVNDGDEVALGRNPRLDESKPVPIAAIVNLLLLE